MKIGKGKAALIKDGNEIGFGSWNINPQKPEEDYRYIFRFTAAGPPTAGLYAHYDIGTELGKGSFATVMSAISRETGKKDGENGHVFLQQGKARKQSDLTARKNNPYLTYFRPHSVPAFRGARRGRCPPTPPGVPATRSPPRHYY